MTTYLVFKSIGEYLNVGMTLPPNIPLSEALRWEALITSKYYYFGGGICRGIFGMPTEGLTKYFQETIESIDT